MTTADGTVKGATKVLDSGPDANLYNIVILAEGYKDAELATFHADVDSFVSTLSTTKPYPALMDSINIYRVDVASTDSGADDPATCGDKSVGTGVTAATYFDATFCGGGAARRVITVNTATAQSVAADQVKAYDLILVFVNSTEYGGATTDGVAVLSRAPGTVKIALHEMGHGAFGFADEYEYYQGCGTDTDRNNHPAVEPTAANATVDSTGQKWRNYILGGTPIPTTKNKDCTACDPQSSPVAAGLVGTFEGADSYHCGAWRPEFTCRMRELNQEFCHVCQGVIVRTLRDHSVLTLRLAWKGVGGDWNIYTGQGIDSDQTKQSAFGTGNAPALARFAGLFMAWRGAGSDQRIWYSILNTEDGITWDQQRTVAGVGTSTAPALAVFNNRLYMAWKGAGSDQSLWYASYSAGIWTPQAAIPNTGTSTQPALAAFNGRLYAAWKGIDGDQGIYFASFDGAHWSAQQKIANVGTSAYPALAALGGRLYMVWKGAGFDPSGWFSSFDGSRWAPQAAIPNVGTSTGFSLCASAKRLYLAWSGVGPDHAIYYTGSDGTHWGPQRSYWGTGSSNVPSILVY